LMVRATAQDLDVIEKAIQMLNMSPPQLTISVKVVELSKEESRGLGFDWDLGSAMWTNASSAGAPDPASITNAIPKGQTDNLITSGLRGSAPQTASLTGILTKDQFRFVMRALEQRNGTEVMSAPSVTTHSGRQAQIKVVDIRYVVTGLNTNAQSAPTNKATKVTDDGRYIVEPFELGPVVDVVPHVQPDGYTIQMTVLPALREFLGYEDPMHDRGNDLPATGGPFATEIFAPAVRDPVPRPKFRLRQVATSALVWDGQTLVLGAGNARHAVTPHHDQVRGEGALLLRHAATDRSGWQCPAR
jgi:general secretion pathway protein D